MVHCVCVIVDGAEAKNLLPSQNFKDHAQRGHDHDRRPVRQQGGVCVMGVDGCGWVWV